MNRLFEDMLPLLCPLGADCDKGPDGTMWFTVDVEFREAKVLLEYIIRMAHNQEVTPTGDGPAQQLRPEKLSRPQLKLKDGQIDEETWEYFKHQWQTYKTSANLTVSAKQHLESCLWDKGKMIMFGRLGQAG